ncbi:hypothetical protein [Bartonella ancashensis]|uniref:hypothetical protein n=1 Tax=Bartonella ancashensis TaxID=1318743 RepID=UPI0039E6260F
MTAEEEAKAFEIHRRIQELISIAADSEEIATALRLLAAGLKVQKNGDYDAYALAYSMALEGISSWALKKAVKQILCGKTEKFGEEEILSRTFFPSAPELVMYCQQLEYKLCWKIVNICTAIVNTRKKANGEKLDHSVFKIENLKISSDCYLNSH